MNHGMAITATLAVVAFGGAGNADAQEVPEWVRDVFTFYADGAIGDEELISAIKFLIDAGVIDVGQAPMPVQSQDRITAPGFTMEYPVNWEYERTRDPALGGTLHMLTEKSTLDLSVPSTIYVSTGYIGDGVSLHDYYVEEVDKTWNSLELLGASVDVEWGASGQDTLSGMPSVWYEYTFHMPIAYIGTVTAYGVDELVRHDGMVYEVSYSGLPDAYNELYDEYLDIVSTFRIVP